MPHIGNPSPRPVIESTSSCFGLSAGPPRAQAIALRMLSFWRRRMPLLANIHAFNTLPTTSIPSKQHNFPLHTSVQEPKTNAMTHLPQSTFGNFDLVKKLKLDFTDVLVSKWRSRRTGLTVIHLDYDGLLFCLCHIVRSG